jgi:RimJ/RimL family protein N-acetyltransferase
MADVSGDATGGAIVTDRLILEPLQCRHAGVLYPLLRSLGLYTFIPRDPPRSVAEVEERFRRREAGSSPDGCERWLNWASRSAATGEYVGILEATVPGDGTALIAYTTFEPFWRRGYGTDGVRAVVAHLWAEPGILRTRADIDTRNQASIRLVERLGFRRVGLTEDADRFKGETSHEFQYLLDRPVAE